MINVELHFQEMYCLANRTDGCVTMDAAIYRTAQIFDGGKY